MSKMRGLQLRTACRNAASKKPATIALPDLAEYIASSFLRDGNMDEQRPKPPGWNWWYILLLVQIIAVLWPPFYNKVEPAWIGLPFFYWYQLLWVIIGAVLTAIVYFATEAEHR